MVWWPGANRFDKEKGVKEIDRVWSPGSRRSPVAEVSKLLVENANSSIKFHKLRNFRVFLILWQNFAKNNRKYQMLGKFSQNGINFQKIVEDFVKLSGKKIEK